MPIPSSHDFERKLVTIGVPGELHFRSGYNPEGLVSLLKLSGFRVVRCSCTARIRILPKSLLLFPFCFIAALVLSKLSKERAKLTVLACSDPPEGHSRWTLKLLADKLVELNLVESISVVAIHKRLKKLSETLADKQLVHRQTLLRQVRRQDGGRARRLPASL